MSGMCAYEKGYVIVTDYIKADTGKDVSDDIQRVIDEHPRKVIFFPDGEYMISKPICTPGHYSKAVSLELSNFAVIKASDDWNSDEAMIRLGGKDPYFQVWENGTNNYITGGVIDGNDIAKGISIDGGREYSVRNISMKRVKVGIHIKRNSEYLSNDSDIFNVNITGNGRRGSIGILAEGFDNTFTNMRTACFEIGVINKGGANIFRNIHPFFVFLQYPDKAEYVNSIGFDDYSSGWYDNCYADNYSVGFRTSGARPIFNNCYGFWYHFRENQNVVLFEATAKFNGVIRSGRMDWLEHLPDANTAFLKVAESGGTGVVENPLLKDEKLKDKTYKEYLMGNVIRSS